MASKRRVFSRTERLHRALALAAGVAGIWALHQAMRPRFIVPDLKPIPVQVRIAHAPKSSQGSAESPRASDSLKVPVQPAKVAAPHLPPAAPPAAPAQPMKAPEATPAVAPAAPLLPIPSPEAPRAPFPSQVAAQPPAEDVQAASGNVLPPTPQPFASPSAPVRPSSTPAVAALAPPAPPAPPASAASTPDNNTGVQPGGQLAVIEYTLNDQGTVIAGHVLVPSNQPLKDMTFAMVAIGRKFHNIVPPLQPGEVRKIQITVPTGVLIQVPTLASSAASAASKPSSVLP